jgi:hypothetical protein
MAKGGVSAFHASTHSEETSVFGVAEEDVQFIGIREIVTDIIHIRKEGEKIFVKVVVFRDG